MRLDPHFQPIVSTETSEIVAHEALFRLAGQGPLPHMQFKRWELSGEVVIIDRLFVRALVDLAMERRLPGSSITVNVSARTISDQADRYLQEAERLKRYVPDVFIELTETYRMTDLAAIRDFKKACDSISVSFGFDDCVMGHEFTDPRVLQAIEPVFMKVDMTVLNKAVDGDTAHITRILELARGIGATTIVEGVDSEMKRQLVGDAKSDCWQGFLAGHPAPVSPAHTLQQLPRHILDCLGLNSGLPAVVPIET